MKRQKRLYVSEYELPIRVEKDKSGGYVAKSPAWSDCYAQADTLDEVTYEITSVAASLIELYKEEGLKIPLKKRASNRSILRIPVYITS